MSPHRRAEMCHALQLFVERGETISEDEIMLDIVDRIVLDPDTVTYGQLDDLTHALVDQTRSEAA